MRQMQRALRLFLLTVDCSLLTGCSVTPLTNKISVGEEAFILAVGEGPDGMTDLYAAPAHGGAFARLSFNRMVESGPRLSEGGRMVAYLRRAPDAAEPPEVVVLDLGNGAEERVALPREAGSPAAVAWLPNNSRIAVRADSGLFGFAPPSAAAVPPPPRRPPRPRRFGPRRAAGKPGGGDGCCLRRRRPLRPHRRCRRFSARSRGPWRSEERRVGKECRSRWSPYH